MKYLLVSIFLAITFSLLPPTALGHWCGQGCDEFTNEGACTHGCKPPEMGGDLDPQYHGGRAEYRESTQQYQPAETAKVSEDNRRLEEELAAAARAAADSAARAAAEAAQRAHQENQARLQQLEAVRQAEAAAKQQADQQQETARLEFEKRQAETCGQAGACMMNGNCDASQFCLAADPGAGICGRCANYGTEGNVDRTTSQKADLFVQAGGNPQQLIDYPETVLGKEDRQALENAKSEGGETYQQVSAEIMGNLTQTAIAAGAKAAAPAAVPTASTTAQTVLQNAKCDANFGLCQAIDPQTGVVTGWVPADKPVFCNRTCALAARMNVIIGTGYTQAPLSDGTKLQVYDPSWNTQQQSLTAEKLTSDQVAAIKKAAEANKVQIDAQGNAIINLTQAQIADLQQRVDNFAKEQDNVQQALMDDLSGQMPDLMQQCNNKSNSGCSADGFPAFVKDNYTNYRYLTADNQTQIASSAQRYVSDLADSNARAQRCLQIIQAEVGLNCDKEVPGISDAEIAAARSQFEANKKAADLANRYQKGEDINQRQLLDAGLTLAAIAELTANRAQNLETARQNQINAAAYDLLNFSGNRDERPEVLSGLDAAAKSEAQRRTRLLRQFLDCRGDKCADLSFQLQTFLSQDVLTEINEVRTGQITFEQAQFQAQAAYQAAAALQAKLDSAPAVTTGANWQLTNTCEEGGVLVTTGSKWSSDKYGSKVTVPVNERQTCPFGCSAGQCSRLSNNFNNNPAHQARYDTSVAAEIAFGKTPDEAYRTVGASDYRPIAAANLQTTPELFNQLVRSHLTPARGKAPGITSVEAERLAREELAQAAALAAASPQANLDPSEWLAYGRIRDTAANLGALTPQVQADILAGNIKPSDIENLITEQAQSIEGKIGVFLNNWTQGSYKRNLEIQLEAEQKILAGDRSLRNYFDVGRGAVAAGAPAAAAMVAIVAAPLAIPVLVAVPAASLLPVALQMTSSAFGIYASTQSWGQTAEVCDLRFQTRSEAIQCGIAAGNAVYMTLSTGLGVINGAAPVAEAVAANKLAAVGANAATVIDDAAAALSAVTKAKNITPPGWMQWADAGNSVLATGVFGTQAVITCGQVITGSANADPTSCLVQAGMAIASAGRLASLGMFATGGEQLGAATGKLAGTIGEGADILDGLSSCRFGFSQCVQGLIDALADPKGIGQSPFARFAITDSAAAQYQTALSAYQSNSTSENATTLRASILAAAAEQAQVNQALGYQIDTPSTAAEQEFVAARQNYQSTADPIALLNAKMRLDTERFFTSADPRTGRQKLGRPDPAFTALQAAQANFAAITQSSSPADPAYQAALLQVRMNLETATLAYHPDQQADILASVQGRIDQLQEQVRQKADFLQAIEEEARRNPEFAVSGVPERDRIRDQISQLESNLAAANQHLTNLQAVTPKLNLVEQVLDQVTSIGCAITDASLIPVAHAAGGKLPCKQTLNLGVVALRKSTEAAKIDPRFAALGNITRTPRGITISGVTAVENTLGNLTDESGHQFVHGEEVWIRTTDGQEARIKIAINPGNDVIQIYIADNDRDSLLRPRETADTEVSRTAGELRPADLDAIVRAAIGTQAPADRRQAQKVYESIAAKLPEVSADRNLANMVYAVIKQQISSQPELAKLVAGFLINAKFDIGSQPGKDIRLDVEGVSRSHATLERQAGQYYLIDNRSTNGTHIRSNSGAPWQEITPDQLYNLTAGMEIRFGPASLNQIYTVGIDPSGLLSLSSLSSPSEPAYIVTLEGRLIQPTPTFTGPRTQHLQAGETATMAVTDVRGAVVDYLTMPSQTAWGLRLAARDQKPVLYQLQNPQVTPSGGNIILTENGTALTVDLGQLQSLFQGKWVVEGQKIGRWDAMPADPQGFRQEVIYLPVIADGKAAVIQLPHDSPAYQYLRNLAPSLILTPIAAPPPDLPLAGPPVSLYSHVGGRLSDQDTLAYATGQSATISFTETLPNGQAGARQTETFNLNLPPNVRVAVVADGAGGAASGELYSYESTKAVLAHIGASSDQIAVGKDIPALLKNAVAAAQAAVSKLQPSDGASTIVAAIVIGDKAYVASLGDSRAYLNSGKGLTLITADHTAARYHEEMGMDKKDALLGKDAEHLAGYLGKNSKYTEPDTFEVDLNGGQLVLVCDGVSKQIGYSGISDVLATTPTAKAAQALAEAAYNAYQKSGRRSDNVSAIVIGSQSSVPKSSLPALSPLGLAPLVAAAIPQALVLTSPVTAPAAVLGGLDFILQRAAPDTTWARAVNNIVNLRLGTIANDIARSFGHQTQFTDPVLPRLTLPFLPLSASVIDTNQIRPGKTSKITVSGNPASTQLPGVEEIAVDPQSGKVTFYTDQETIAVETGQTRVIGDLIVAVKNIHPDGTAELEIDVGNWAADSFNPRLFTEKTTIKVSATSPFTEQTEPLSLTTLEFVGSGGLGEVYATANRYTHPTLNIPFRAFLKVSTNKPGSADLLNNEYALLVRVNQLAFNNGRLNHLPIPLSKLTGESLGQGTTAYLMEGIDGTTLQSYPDPIPQESIDEFQTFLSFLNQNGIHHRDISARNILVSSVDTPTGKKIILRLIDPLVAPPNEIVQRVIRSPRSLQAIIETQAYPLYRRTVTAEVLDDYQIVKEMESKGIIVIESAEETTILEPISGQQAQEILNARENHKQGVAIIVPASDTEAFQVEMKIRDWKNTHPATTPPTSLSSFSPLGLAALNPAVGGIALTLQLPHLMRDVIVPLIPSPAFKAFADRLATAADNIYNPRNWPKAWADINLARVPLVPAECVTGDTLLKRRKKRKAGGTDPDPDTWEDVRIDQIEPGDEILTLDEITGKFIPSVVEGLMRKGVQTIWKLTTASGKTIRTTSEHPYLAKTHRAKPRVGIFFDNANLYFAAQKAGWKIDPNKLVKLLSTVFDVAFANYYIAIPDKDDPAYVGTAAFLRHLSSSITVRSKPLKYIKQGDGATEKKGDVDVELVLDVVRTVDDLDLVIVVSGDSDYLELARYVEKDEGKQIAFAGYESNMAWELRQKQHLYLNRDPIKSAVAFGGHKKAPSSSPGVTLLRYLYHDQTPLSSAWTKVKHLKVGQKIAVLSSALVDFEEIASIEKVGQEEVFDIEVEGTHNFVGNGIVAHNTTSISDPETTLKSTGLFEVSGVKQHESVVTDVTLRYQNREMFPNLPFAGWAQGDGEVLEVVLGRTLTPTVTEGKQLERKVLTFSLPSYGRADAIPVITEATDGTKFGVIYRKGIGGMRRSPGVWTGDVFGREGTTVFDEPRIGFTHSLDFERDSNLSIQWHENGMRVRLPIASFDLESVATTKGILSIDDLVKEGIIGSDPGFGNPVISIWARRNPFTFRDAFQIVTRGPSSGGMIPFATKEQMKQNFDVLLRAQVPFLELEDSPVVKDIAGLLQQGRGYDSWFSWLAQTAGEEAGRAPNFGLLQGNMNPQNLTLAIEAGDLGDQALDPRVRAHFSNQALTYYLVPVLKLRMLYNVANSLEWSTGLKGIIDGFVGSMVSSSDNGLSLLRDLNNLSLYRGKSDKTGYPLKDSFDRSRVRAHGYATATSDDPFFNPNTPVVEGFRKMSLGDPNVLLAEFIESEFQREVVAQQIIQPFNKVGEKLRFWRSGLPSPPIPTTLLYSGFDPVRGIISLAGKISPSFSRAAENILSGNWGQIASDIGASITNEEDLGQCVTGDTKLRRRRRKRANSEVSLGVDFEEVRIDEIESGDEILSLNEATGQFEWSRVKRLMDKGVQTVWRVTTESGKMIRTTSEHPYLARTLGTSDRVVSQSEAERLFGEFRQAFSFRKLDGDINQRESYDYQGESYQSSGVGIPQIDHSNFLSKRMLNSKHSVPATMLPVNISQFEGRLMASEKVGMMMTVPYQAAERFMDSPDKALMVASLSLIAERDDIETSVVSVGDNVNLGVWVKVKDLKVGQMIAVMGAEGQQAWDKIRTIEKVGREQVYDIEVEGTHNFVGNGIVAHNTSTKLGTGTLARARGPLADTGQVSQIISDVHTQVRSELVQLKSGQEIVDYIIRDLESMGVEVRDGTPRVATKGHDVVKDVGFMSEIYVQIDRKRPASAAHEWEHARQVKAFLDAGIPTGLIENKLYVKEAEAAAYATGTKLAYSTKGFNLRDAYVQPVAYALSKSGFIGPLNTVNRGITSLVNRIKSSLGSGQPLGIVAPLDFDWKGFRDAQSGRIQFPISRLTPEEKTLKVALGNIYKNPEPLDMQLEEVNTLLYQPRQAVESGQYEPFGLKEALSKIPDPYDIFGELEKALKPGMTDEEMTRLTADIVREKTGIPVHFLPQVEEKYPPFFVFEYRGKTYGTWYPFTNTRPWKGTHSLAYELSDFPYSDAVKANKEFFNRKAAGLTTPGELGPYIIDDVSKRVFINRQDFTIILINEARINESSAARVPVHELGHAVEERFGSELTKDAFKPARSEVISALYSIRYGQIVSKFDLDKAVKIAQPEIELFNWVMYGTVAPQPRGTKGGRKPSTPGVESLSTTQLSNQAQNAPQVSLAGKTVSLADITPEFLDSQRPGRIIYLLDASGQVTSAYSKNPDGSWSLFTGIQLGNLEPSGPKTGGGRIVNMLKYSLLQPPPSRLLTNTIPVGFATTALGIALMPVSPPVGTIVSLLGGPYIYYNVAHAPQIQVGDFMTVFPTRSVSTVALANGQVIHPQTPIAEMHIAREERLQAALPNELDRYRTLRFSRTALHDLLVLARQIETNEKLQNIDSFVIRSQLLDPQISGSLPSAFEKVGLSFETPTTNPITKTLNRFSAWASTVFSTGKIFHGKKIGEARSAWIKASQLQAAIPFLKAEIAKVDSTLAKATASKTNPLPRTLKISQRPSLLSRPVDTTVWITNANVSIVSPQGNTVYQDRYTGSTNELTATYTPSPGTTLTITDTNETFIWNGKFWIGSELPPSSSLQGQALKEEDLGQCVTGDSLVMTDAGKLVRVDQIKGGEMIYSLDQQSGKWVPAKVLALLDMGVKPVFRLVTETGKEIRTTGNHPYLVRSNSAGPGSGGLFGEFEGNVHQQDDYEQQAGSNLNVGANIPEITHFSTSFSNKTVNNKNTLPNPRYDVNLTGGVWTRVVELAPGMEIATVEGWEKIATIERLGEEQVYDLSIEGTHNFVGNGIVAHNTTVFESRVPSPKGLVRVGRDYVGEVVTLVRSILARLQPAEVSVPDTDGITETPQGQTLQEGRVEVVSGDLVRSSRKEIMVGLATQEGQREIKLVVEGNSREEILAGIARQLDEAGVISGTEFTLRVPITAADAGPTIVELRLRYTRQTDSLQGQALKAKISISGLPEGLEIKDPGWGGPAGVSEAKELEFLAQRDDWSIFVRESEGELDLFVKPVVTDNDNILDLGNGRYIDQSLATVKDGEVVLLPDSGYTTELPSDKAIYRGIYHDEIIEIARNGEIRSRGDVVSYISLHRNLTFFAENTQNPQSAANHSVGYAFQGQRTPASYAPSFKKPNYLLVVRKPDKVPDFTGSGEIAYREPIPIENIIAVYEVRPYLITEGSFPLERGDDWVRPTLDVVRLSQNRPQVEVVYKRMSFEEAVKLLEIKHVQTTLAERVDEAINKKTETGGVQFPVGRSDIKSSGLPAETIVSGDEALLEAKMPKTGQSGGGIKIGRAPVAFLGGMGAGISLVAAAVDLSDCSVSNFEKGSLNLLAKIGFSSVAEKYAEKFSERCMRWPLEVALPPVAGISEELQKPYGESRHYFCDESDPDGLVYEILPDGTLIQFGKCAAIAAAKCQQNRCIQQQQEIDDAMKQSLSLYGIDDVEEVRRGFASVSVEGKADALRRDYGVRFFMGDGVKWWQGGAVGIIKDTCDSLPKFWCQNITFISSKNENKNEIFERKPIILLDEYSLGLSDTDRELFGHIIMHELAHTKQSLYGASIHGEETVVAEYLTLSGWYWDIEKRQWQPQKGGVPMEEVDFEADFLGNYRYHGHYEHFAEMAVAYYEDSQELEESDPLIYNFLKIHFFDGREYKDGEWINKP